jgi:sec-independent protein translocase protein TatA
MMDVFSPTHLLILLVLVLVLFGPSKLGDLGGAVGRAIHDFKKAMHEPVTLVVGSLADSADTPVTSGSAVRTDDRMVQ